MAIQTVTADTLTEFNNERMRVSEPEPVEEKKPDPVEAKAEPEKAEVEEEKVVEKQDDDKPAPKKGNHKIESRFSELTEARRQAEARAADLEAKLAQAEARLQPAKQAPAVDASVGPEPKAADYTDAFDYARDLAEWSTNKALKERDKADAEKVQKAQVEKVLGGWKSRVEAVKAERPDWTEMVESSKAQVSDPARDALIESEYGPQIVYDMSEDDELAEKVSAMKPAEQLRWIGRMEAKYEAAKPAEKEEKAEPVKERPKAPAPISAVKGTRVPDNAVSEPGEFQGSFKEWKALRKKQGAAFA